MTVRVRVSEAGEVSWTLSRPGRALARRADGDVPFDDARTRDCLPSQLGRTTGGGRASAVFHGRTANLAPPERPTGGRTVPGRTAAAVGRLPAAHRSGRVSGIRPSDRRGPGPAGHRGRNVRSTGRCSYNLRITRRRADSCGLHRSTSQVIRRSGSGVFFFLFSSKFFHGPWAADGLSTGVTIFRSTLGRGSRRAGGRRAGRERTRPRGRIRRARDRQVLPVPRARL